MLCLLSIEFFKNPPKYTRLCGYRQKNLKKFLVRGLVPSQSQTLHLKFQKFPRGNTPNLHSSLTGRGDTLMHPPDNPLTTDVVTHCSANIFYKFTCIIVPDSVSHATVYLSNSVVLM